MCKILSGFIFTVTVVGLWQPHTHLEAIESYSPVISTSEIVTGAQNIDSSAAENSSP